MRTRLTALVLAVAAVVGPASLAGCSSGEKGLSKDKVAEKISDGLAKQTGQKPKSVACDGGLDAKVGDKTRCVITAPNDEKIGVGATVTDVKGKTVEFDYKVDDKVMGK